jgi:hypothetical protein
MPPTLVLVRFGRVRRFLLPLPVFLLWPLLLLGWLGLGLAWLATSGWGRPSPVTAGIAVLRLVNELHGTRIDFRGRDATINMRFI